MLGEQVLYEVWKSVKHNTDSNCYDSPNLERASWYLVKSMVCDPVDDRIASEINSKMPIAIIRNSQL